MGLFKMFNKKKSSPEPQVYDMGQVGTNPNQKLVKRGNDLFIQEKGFMGKIKEVPIHKESDKKTMEVKNEEQ